MKRKREILVNDEKKEREEENAFQLVQGVIYLITLHYVHVHRMTDARVDKKLSKVQNLSLLPIPLYFYSTRRFYLLSSFKRLSITLFVFQVGLSEFFYFIVNKIR